MSNDITRIVTYEEIVQILEAGCKKNGQFDPTIEDCTLYADLVGKVVSSTNAMVNYCINHDIPYTLEGKNLLSVRVRTMRDTEAEYEATAYMRNKCHEWNGSWTSEFVGFYMGWRSATEHHRS